MTDTGTNKLKAILVGLVYPGQKEGEAEEFLDELSFLTETAGAETSARFLQKLEMPDPRTYVGSGKIQEIAAFVAVHDIGLLSLTMNSLRAS
jgi:GTP-binding protein HflX